MAAIAVGVVVALLVVLLATREPAADRKSTSQLIGQQAPAIGGEPLLGDPFDIGATDRWVVVNFFASWCVPCVEEHPELVAFSEEHAETGDARVVSVVYSDKEEDVLDFFGRFGGDWTVFDSDQGRTALDWGVARVPESYLVAPTGVVVAWFVSGVTQTELNAVIDRYTQETGS
ncbi:MAG: redoxin family protein [Acidimicrobiales bacterium]|nr:redoxin family protein [Acidimicrobiales bacterium]